MATHEIEEIINDWKLSFSHKTSDKLCSLYADTASLWGTLSAVRRNTPELIKDYFDLVFKYDDRSVQFTDFDVRIFDKVALSSGTYRLNWKNCGVDVVIDARFSFVFALKLGGWVIIEHHSSILPKSP